MRDAAGVCDARGKPSGRNFPRNNRACAPGVLEMEETLDIRDGRKIINGGGPIPGKSTGHGRAMNNGAL